MGVLTALKNINNSIEQVRVASHNIEYTDLAVFRNAHISNFIPTENSNAYMYLLMGWSWSITYSGALEAFDTNTKMRTKLALMASKNDDSVDSNVTFASLFSEGAMDKSDSDILWTHQAAFTNLTNVPALTPASIMQFNSGNDGVVMLPSPILVPNLCLWVNGEESNLHVDATQKITISFNVYYSKKLAAFDLIEKITRQFQTFRQRR